MYGGELPCARNCAGGFLFFAQVNLHFLNLGTHIEEFLIKWSRLRGDGLHMVSVVVPYKLGSFRDLPILVPPLEMGFDIFGGLVSHWFVAPFTAGGVEQNRLVDNVISKTEKLGSQWGITHLRCDFVTKTFSQIDPRLRWMSFIYWPCFSCCCSYQLGSYCRKFCANGWG